MTPLRACERCDGNELWRVPAVMERGYFGWEKLGWADGLDPIAADICCACWHVTWRATVQPDLPHLPRFAQRVAGIECPECYGHEHAMITAMSERTIDPGTTTIATLHVDSGTAAGHFDVVMCDGCGRLDWLARDVANVGSKPDECECHRCGQATVRSLRPFREEGGTPLPVVVGLTGARGEFELRYCSDCGACDWRAHGVAKLAERRKQIVDARERVPVAGGPYR